jgi:hypothetical protein
MLSVVDLLEAGTLTTIQAAWLLLRVLQGSSWLVGAKPGGAGKTTVMSALLAMVPRASRIWLTNRGDGWDRCGGGEYVVSYELSPGFYDAYIWGPDVVRLTRLGMKGCRIVSNLHADTLDEARTQVVGECGATEEGFRSFRLFIPLELTGSRYTRTPTVSRIDYVREGRWLSWHREDRRWPGDPTGRASSRVDRIQEFLEQCRTGNLRLIEGVREAWLQWCEGNLPNV